MSPPAVSSAAGKPERRRAEVQSLVLIKVQAAGKRDAAVDDGSRVRSGRVVQHAVVHPVALVDPVLRETDLGRPQHRRFVVLIALGDADEHSVIAGEVVVKTAVDLIDIEHARTGCVVVVRICECSALRVRQRHVLQHVL